MPSTRTMIDVATERLEALRQTVQGEVFAPEDAGYEEARLAWNRVVDQYPALIVRAANAADVVEAVRFARAEDLPIAVQATGHGVVTRRMARCWCSPRA
jgi:FAD/FMN-containing dehydrogenase